MLLDRESLGGGCMGSPVITQHPMADPADPQRIRTVPQLIVLDCRLNGAVTRGQSDSGVTVENLGHSELELCRKAGARVTHSVVCGYGAFGIL